ncbi:GAF domain-containing protein [bacterium]|nr:MAG: GAF domain-containing protein [bacterium]
MTSTLDWEFPLPRTHCGVPLGNGTLGVNVWGDETLCLSVARAGFWDRRGGTPFTLRATFDRVRERLEANDEAGLKALFASDEADDPSRPNRPQQLGGARVEFRFEGGFSPRHAVLHLERGQLEVELRNPSDEVRTVTIWVHPDDEVCVVEGADDAEVTVRPSWEWVARQLIPLGYSAPEMIQIGDGGGFVQDVPENEVLALVWRRRSEGILIATALDGDLEDAAKAAVTRARALPDTGAKFFWDGYWRDVPTVELPDEELNRKWKLGLWKQAGLTTPGGVAATLQGPWMEEDKLPPWSNDYHFNINVQLIYYPALMTNRLEHFGPLWRMIRGWMPTLRANGEVFFGREGALMLPHAVDDECHVVGTFWTGTIDHGCTAWVAQMAWLHYAYGGDISVLRNVAWPLLKGAFEGFWGMSEEREAEATATNFDAEAERTLHRLMRRIAMLTEAENCVLLLPDEERNELVALPFAIGFSNKQLKELRLSAVEGAAARAFSEGTPIILDEGSDEEWVRRIDARSLIIYPLESEGEAESAGVILVLNKLEQPAFTPEDLQPLSVIARQVAGQLAGTERKNRLSLPVTVSPEYRGAAMNAWGRDASFQLAAWHMVAQLLPKAAALLGEPIDECWQEVEERLPLWSLVGDEEHERIALWEGLELEESHRHHSHMAAIWPFASVDPFEHEDIVVRSIQHWNALGAGLWTGWCLPWASILCSRFDLPDAAVAWMNWLDHYTNVGGGTRHNADFSGVALFDNGEMDSRRSDGTRRPYSEESEVMQMDASLGFLIAVSELLVQNRRDAIYVLPALPRKWKRLRFDGIRTEGAFLLGATVEGGRTIEVRVRCERDGVLKLVPGLGEQFEVAGEIVVGVLLEREMKKGQSLVLTRV